MTATGEILNSTPTTTAKPKKLGSRFFRPNGVILSNEYRMIWVTEIIVFLILWLFLPRIIPTPMDILASLRELIDQQGLIGELWTSLVLSVQAIILSTLIGMVLSYGASIPVIRPISIAVGSTRFLSMAGLTFIFTLLTGGGHALKLAILVFIMTGFFTRSMVDVVLQVSDDRMDYVRTLRANEWQVLYEARILGTLGALFDIVRQNAAMGWAMLTLVEGIVRGEGGIGKMLLDQEKHFSLSAILAVQAVVLTVGSVQDILIGVAKSWIAPWTALGQQAKR